MAISTYKVFLMKKDTSGSTYTKVVDIKDFPDLGGAPEMLETTTLSDGMQTYNKDDYATLAAMKDTETEFAVWFGGTESNGVVTPTGSEGKFEFKGKLSVFVVGGGVNEVVDMTITIAPSTPITVAAA